MPGACIVDVRDAIPVAVKRADVTHAVLIEVALRWVGRVEAVVGGIGNAVAIRVAILTGVRGIRGASVLRISDSVAVTVAVARKVRNTSVVRDEGTGIA